MASLLDMYEMYHNIRTDAPKAFATLEGCQMIGHLMGRKCYNLIQPDAVYHNMYLALIGESTISRKSTSQRIGREVFPRSLCRPDESSPEQFLVELSDHPQYFKWYGEFSYLLKGIKGNSWMSRMAEVMNHIFDCPRTYTKTLRARQGEPTVFHIENAYLSFNTTCTPDMMEKHLDAEAMVGGFLPRFLLNEGDANPRPRRRLDPQFNLFQTRLDNLFHQLYRLAADGVVFELTDDALKRYNEIEVILFKHKNILPFAGRYLNYIISIADILLVSDAFGDYVIEPFDKNYNKLLKLDNLVKLYKLDKLINTNNIYNTNFTNFTSIPVDKVYIDRAYEIIKPCLIYAKKLVEFVDVFLPYAKVKKQIIKHNDIEHSVLQRNTHLRPFEIVEAIKMLEEENYITIEVVSKEGIKDKRVYHKIKRG